MNKSILYRIGSLGLAACLSPLCALGQGSLGDGTFQNLDFSAADVEFIGSSQVQIETGPALPGWNASIGGVTPSFILYNDLSAGSATVALLGPAPPIVGGNYTVVLQGSGFARTGAVSLQQTGIVPAGANSIQFLSGTYPFYSKSIVNFGLNVNGQPINLVPASVGNNVWSYSGNISQFAGQNATLDFYSMSGVSSGNFYLGEITFSSQVIPEPSLLTLFGIGGLVLADNLRRKRD